MPAFPREAGAPNTVEFPSRAVAPPNRINCRPMYPGVPSSPTAATVMSVWPHLGLGPSSFFSRIASTTDQSKLERASDQSPHFAIAADDLLANAPVTHRRRIQYATRKTTMTNATSTPLTVAPSPLRGSASPDREG
ncbi:hypothetical protein PIB30_031341 [Stylosanthes scabra]|uniref:Uncharacterized protein n=1 Tax=Stylosanthes scabra TaxID=79078 RepID=A0ABU6UB98_9FABA|nr:hypothetical protein [Stylosanthes scabra]